MNSFTFQNSFKNGLLSVKDKRHHNRISIALPVRWNGLSGNTEAHVSDLSLNGCYIDTMASIPTTGTLSFDVQLPTGNWLELKGSVVKAFPGIGYGIQFLDLSKEAQLAIANLIG
jgi:hypothetical protein